jgi:hypothetical protein
MYYVIQPIHFKFTIAGSISFETTNYNNTSNYFDGVSRGREQLLASLLVYLLEPIFIF